MLRSFSLSTLNRTSENYFRRTLSIPPPLSLETNDATNTSSVPYRRTASVACYHWALTRPSRAFGPRRPRESRRDPPVTGRRSCRVDSAPPEGARFRSDRGRSRSGGVPDRVRSQRASVAPRSGSIPWAELAWLCTLPTSLFAIGERYARPGPSTTERGPRTPGHSGGGPHRVRRGPPAPALRGCEPLGRVPARAVPVSSGHRE